MRAKIKKELQETKVLLRNVPTLVMTFFVLSIIAMNLLANKSVDLGVSWLAMDAGIIVAWVAFLATDILTKHFGAKATIKLSIIASMLNLFLCGIFFVGGRLIPGMWGESFIEVGGDIVNTALDNTFAGTWYVLLGSTVAFLVSSVVDALINEGIGKRLKTKNEFMHFSIRSYVSTAIGQFIDNLVFSLIVSLNFFGWTFLQCVMCSFIGAIIELICEFIFAPVGFRIVSKWKKDNVGKEYIDLVSV